MAIAQQDFYASVKGNGFPFCLGRVDVETQHMWTTLSGVNKNAPTPSPTLIHESHRLAIKLYYHLSKVNFLYQRPGFPDNTDGYILERDDLPLEPADRGCKGAIPFFKNVADVGTMYITLIQDSSWLVRMYNSGEYVGIGLRSARAVSARALSLSLPVFGNPLVTVGGHIETTDVGSSPVTNIFDEQYTALNTDYHIVCQTRITEASGWTEVSDAANLTASITRDSDGVISGVTLNSLEFYTYA